MWETFQEKEKALFRFCNGKKVCLWGYGQTGRFCEHLFLRENKIVEYIIDDAVYDCRADIERSFILKELDKDTSVILLAFPRENKAVSFLTQLGFTENKDYVFVRDWFYGNEEENRKLSYYDWLEYTYQIDITAFKLLDEIEKPNEDSFYYSPGVDYGLVDVLDNFEFDNADSVFDFGCGKGGAILLFYSAGVSRIGGVEYDEELYRTAVENLKKMGIDSSGIFNRDAAKIRKELDSYNFFFMYNPFEGVTFEHVIKNLEESYQRQKRMMYLIYANPYNHDLVVKDGIFKQSKMIKTDYSVRNVRIYCTGK